MPTSGMGQIFTIGLTAALAWELPHEPIDFKTDDKNTAVADQRVDKPSNIDVRPVYQPSGSQHQTYQTQQSLQTSWPSDRNPSISIPLRWDAAQHSEHPNSRFITVQGDRSSGPQTSYVDDSHNDNGEHFAYRNAYLYRKHGEAHRRTRRDLFGKIAKFFSA